MPSLVIETMNGEFFSLDDVNPGDTVASVKAKIQDMKGIPIIRQKLTLFSYWHPPTVVFDHYELPDGLTEHRFDTWQLETFIDITIRKMDGSSLTVEVEAHEFIWNVKSCVSEPLSISPFEQRLILDETRTELKNKMRLSQCNVQNNSILLLIIQQPAVYWWSPELEIAGDEVKEIDCQLCL